MMTNIRLAARGALLAGAVLALAACGSVVTAGASHPARPGAGRGAPSAAAARASAGVPLCTAARQPDQLEVRLTPAQPREILPRMLVSTDAGRVRALARALCALPPLPRGVHCLAVPRAALLLVFAAPERAVSTVRIQDAHCPDVTGLGPARQWSWSSPAGQLLRKTAGGTGKLVPDTHPSSVPMH